MVDTQFTSNFLPLSSYWKLKLRSRYINRSTASVYDFAANVSVTSFSWFSHKDEWVNAQLRNPLATINLVIFISHSECGLEAKSWSLSMLSERGTHLHIDTHHKDPLDILTVNQLINQSNTQSVSQSVSLSVNSQSVHQWIPLGQESVSFWVSIVRKRRFHQNYQ